MQTNKLKAAFLFFGMHPAQYNLALVSYHTLRRVSVSWLNLVCLFQALPLVTVVLGGPTSDLEVTVVTNSEDVDEPRRMSFNMHGDGSQLSPGKPAWANYVKGVMHHYRGTKSWVLHNYKSISVWFVYKVISPFLWYHLKTSEYT